MKYISVELLSAFKQRQWNTVQQLVDKIIRDDRLKEALIDGYIALHEAINRHAPVEVITPLITRHNVNKRNLDGKTALHLAVKREIWELVPILLNFGADIDIADGVNSAFPLHIATLNNAPANIIAKLISPNNINKQAKYGSSALHLAAIEKRWELVPVLIQMGADVTLRNSFGSTPLHNALFLESDAPVDVLALLISNHNVNMRDHDGDTALHLVVKYEMWELVPILIQYGADSEGFRAGVAVSVASLRDLCIAVTRANMTVKSDEAFDGLGLPRKLLPEVKLRSVADDIVLSRETDRVEYRFEESWHESP